MSVTPTRHATSNTNTPRGLAEATIFATRYCISNSVYAIIYIMYYSDYIRYSVKFPNSVYAIFYRVCVISDVFFITSIIGAHIIFRVITKKSGGANFRSESLKTLGN